MWSSLFGGSSSAKAKELPKKAIVELREHVNLLNKKQSHLQTQIATQEGEARRFLGAGNKTMAKNALKKKKVYEGQLVKLDAQIDSLEQQLFSIESANMNLETMRAMKQGARAMKAMHAGMDIDTVDETMDDIREQVELGDEISDAISRPIYTGVNDVDEDELDEELDMLAQQEAANSVQVAPEAAVAQPAPGQQQRVPQLPDAPVGEIAHAETPQAEDEEDEDERALRELQAEMGL